MSELIGKRVRIRKNQRRLGGDKYPGRYGTVLRTNVCDDKLFYIVLEPTARAKERIETFWQDDFFVAEEHEQ